MDLGNLCGTPVIIQAQMDHFSMLGMELVSRADQTPVLTELPFYWEGKTENSNIKRINTV